VNLVVYILKKDVMYDFLLDIKNKFETYVPIKKDITRFKILDNPKDIDFSENSYFPVKEHFFRKKEVIFQFNGSNFLPVELKSKNKIFFGLRRCDLNAIKNQDFIFMKQHNDPYYTSQRKKAVLIGYHCTKALNKYCFCESMNLTDYYDLMLFDKTNYFLVDAKTEKGENLIRKYKKYFKKSNYKISDKDTYIKTRKINKKDISKFYDHKDWDKGINLCLSCSACTEMCPTCYCHEIHDNTEINNPRNAKRIRSWSSCQLKEFTSVAENHTFRDTKEARFKHRIYHQLQYFKERNKINLCTGCGRCITGCPTKIDWVKIINEMR